MATILIIDDEEHIRQILAARIELMGHDALTASDLSGGLSRLDAVGVDLVFLDVNLPDGNGLDALLDIRRRPDAPQVIIITAAGSSQGAKMAFKNGAWDYIQKPFYKDELILQVGRALEYRQARQSSGKRVLLETGNIIGKSKSLVKSLEQVAQCAATMVNVLIQGESGTGKELFAKSIHDNCPRTPGRYLVVDCAAMPETLIESLLFGHKKGAFTGADKDAEGLVKMADNGTLFLDEIGELPLSAQKKFFTGVAGKKFRPVGSSKEISSNFRLVSATNRDLEQMVAKGRFRNDLLHRLKTFVIEPPPLRGRTEDIRELALHYTQTLCRRHGVPEKVLLPDTMEVLQAYQWPGNVRELINIIETAVLSDPHVELIYPMQLPAHVRLSYTEKNLGRANRTDRQTGPVRGRVLDAGQPVPVFKAFREKALDQIEADYFGQLLAKTGWDLKETAVLSGLSKNRVYYFIRKHRLKKP